ncbi:UNVERIFIED_CONTAM: DEAD/DEAH box helicase family protein [Halobacillus marinus]
MWKIEGKQSKLITSGLQEELVTLIDRSTTIYVLSAFLMKSGVALLRPHLEKAAKRGADIKVLTGDYLYVTQPEALKMLVGLPNEVEIRLWKSNGKSFHPKAFIFSGVDSNDLIVGSSNMSRSALTTGIEWNLYINGALSQETFDDAQETYIQLFYDDQTWQVNVETIKHYDDLYHQFHRKHPDLVHTWTDQEEIELTLGTEDLSVDVIREGEEGYIANATVDQPKPKPRYAQPEALENLEDTYNEGYSKAMVVMATGLGKTYLAAFFAEKFDKVLFIAHREEILHQARASFAHVMPYKTHGIYNGRMKDNHVDMLFASIFTLSIQEHLLKFDPTEFDLIVIDEFHHASSKSYQKAINYFKPQFLMGITATPERTDGNDIFAICDGNVAYEMNFIQAIQKGWLAPFHYYGVSDVIDYSQITWIGNRYSEEELAERQLQEDTASNIFEKWMEYRQTRTLGFCSSIRQAQYLADYFNNRGYKSISLHSRTKDISREEAIKQLESTQLDIIFTVDLFNEGIDIPSVDTLLFVRPTESLVVFTQQIGRGLRKHEGKSHCTIIDLIGNYRNADVKMQLFEKDAIAKKEKKSVSIVPRVPEGCEIHMETETIQLLEELLRKRSPRKERAIQTYYQVKQDLGRRPTYLDLHLHGSIESKEYKQIWKSYAGFLTAMEELSEKEVIVYEKHKQWMEEVEGTSMAKSYKMVVLKYMLSRGRGAWVDPVTPEEVAPFFHNYLTEKTYRKQIDFSNKNTKALWDYDESKVAKLIASMPMTKWSGGSKGLIQFKNNLFSLNFTVPPEEKDILLRMTEEICDYRLHTYFERKHHSTK